MTLASNGLPCRVRSVPPRRLRARGWRALAAAFGAAALVLAPAAAASAHNSLISVTPADGSTVVTAPASVDLVFDDAAIALGTEVQVLGPDGTNLSAGEPVLADSTVSQPLVAERPAGTYTVLWRVTSADGHPLSGQLTFTASTAVGPPAVEPPVAASPAARTPAPSPEATASSEPTATVQTTTASASRPADDGGGGLGPWMIAAVVLAGVFAGGVVWRARRARS